MAETLIKNFTQISKVDTEIAGGKGASLGEMTKAGIPVPGGFVILSNAFDRFLEETDLNVEIDAVLDTVDINKVHTVENSSEKIQAMILSREMPEDIKTEILKFYKTLNCKFVAVRSSATSEDSASAAWAGQLDSFLNTTNETLLENVKKCWASLFTPRAIFYRFEKKLNKDKISVAVVVQKMVGSEESGIAFSVHPVTQDENQIIIEAGFGLGEAIVSGSITPDSYVVDKQGVSILDINVNEQTKALYKKAKGGNEWKELGEKGKKQVLTEKEIVELSKLIIKIENHYDFPCDIEWAKAKGRFYIVQSRPITTLTNKSLETTNKETHIDWTIVARKGQDFCVLLMDVVLKGFLYGRKAPKNLGFKPQFFRQYNKGRWFESHELKLFKNEFIQKVDDDPTFLKTVMEAYQQELNRLRKLGDTVAQYAKQNKNPKIIFKKIVRTQALLWSYLYYYFIFDEYLTQKVKSIVVKYDLGEAGETTFFMPVLISERILEKKSLINVLNKKETIDEFLDNFRHLGHCWFYGKDYNKKDILERLKSVDKKAEASVQNHEENKERTEQLFKKLNKNERAFVEGFQLLLYNTNTLDDNYSYFLSKSMNFFQSLAKKMGITYNQLRWMTIDEILEGFDVTQIERREQSHSIELVHEEIILKELDTIVKNQNLKEYIIKGTIANKGRAQGKVCIVNSVEDNHNISKGDILVSVMTQPAFIPAMEKAAAIVTDIGGLTCHAAIVSRELGKPCIVSAKIATQVLNNGDFVEVDANQGVVKIIKK